MSGGRDDGVMAAALVEVLPDHATEVAYRRQIAAAAFESGRAAGVAEEHDRQLAEEAQRRREMAALTAGARPGSRYRTHDEIERCRWLVRGEERTRATFGRPHPADYQGGAVRADLAEGGPA